MKREKIKSNLLLKFHSSSRSSTKKLMLGGTLLVRKRAISSGLLKDNPGIMGLQWRLYRAEINSCYLK